MSTAQESQQYPGHDQQGERGDSAPLIHSGDTLLGMLHPALGSSVQESYGPVEAGPVEGHEAVLPQKMNRMLD